MRNHLYMMNRSCGAIDMGSGADCDNLPTGGTRARLLLANYDDITSYTEDADGIISAITLDGAAKFYEFLGFRNDVKKSEEVVKPEIGIPKFKHNCGFVIYENTQLQKNNVEKIARGRFVAIVENKGKGDNSYEVIGKGVGVEIVAGAIRNAHENGGFFVISLSTPDDQGELEPKLPQTLQVVDSGFTIYQATSTYLDTIVQAES
jgi:hypothetical protein